ncbi:uncharacterized protein E0L32_001411 [Thyridium curvatum]|uniref:PAS domain-containing protein n=1 Tax=Thyridium curvatum TaxID=1093900 RepID=A0A507AUN9_9PEZI|nr:uncharacterized protein E0L32_001411 [Thyridium curvatum]TPX10214.1 hypothetical protein E0L32_001411 [Thyridium curvatum]
MNSWEACALQYNYPGESGAIEQQRATMRAQSTTFDSIIYPGLYAPSGFDMMSILIRIATRPNPLVHVGAIDSSCALILCDLQQPDQPIVYASEPFYELTGYSHNEVLGRNCRFLQAPGGNVAPGSSRRYINRDLLRRMRKSVDRNVELQLEVPNFRKNGTPFVNILTMIPVRWDSADFNYSVGLQCARD